MIHNMKSQGFPWKISKLDNPIAQTTLRHFRVDFLWQLYP